MPRRFATTHLSPSRSGSRLKFALLEELERPKVDEVISSQDSKLHEIKKLVFSTNGGPLRLCAEPALPLASLMQLSMPSLVISTHFNDHEQALIAGVQQRPFDPIDVDFSKAEDFLQLEAPIDARKDQNMLKLATDIPRRNFMSRILHRYPINRKRLAFIQRRANAKPMELVGALATGKGDSKDMTISCQVCNQRFSKQHHFQRHILTHVDPEHKKFLCQICGKRFNRADHLNRHAILHGDIKVHKCLLCGEEFDRASHLDRHRRKLHPPAGQPPSQTPPLTPQSASPLEFSPSVSPDTGSGNNLHLLAAVATPDGQLDPTLPMDHTPLHLDAIPDSELQIVQGQMVVMETVAAAQMAEPERPFECEFCHRKFIRATHLRRHMRIHTGEKPFACHICGRRYARGDYLRAHIHAHRRDKLHKCKHCGEVFHDLTRFADHCRAVHKDNDDEFGNPRPPPENSPPPPPVSHVLGGSLVAEAAEEITVVAAPVRHEVQGLIPQITLVNIPDAEELSVHHLPSPHHLPPGGHAPLSAPELQLLHTLHGADMTAALGQKPHLLDPLARYMMPNGNSNNSNGAPPILGPPSHPCLPAST